MSVDLSHFILMSRTPIDGAPLHEGPPRYSNVRIWFEQSDVVILRRQRDDEYLVTHAENARWFRTDRTGADSIARLIRNRSCTNADYVCHRDEAVFLHRVQLSGFFKTAKESRPDRPTVVCLSLTERCNLECDYCFYAAGYRNKDAFHVESQPWSEVGAFLEELCEINPCVRIYLTGGEPFANAEIMGYFPLIKERRLYAGVVTNGTLLTREKIRRMKEIGVDEVRVSLDGASEAVHNASRPGSFHKVMGALELLEEFDLQVVLSMTVTKMNELEVPGVAALAKSRGFGLNISHTVPTGRASDHPELLPDYESLVRSLAEVDDEYRFGILNMGRSQGRRNHTCGLAGQSMFVDLSGRAAPCNMLSTTRTDIGNVFQDGIAGVLSSERSLSLRVSVDEIEHCRECHIRYICGGPCRASSLFATGSIKVRGPDCRFKYAEVIESMFRAGSHLAFAAPVGVT